MPKFSRQNHIIKDMVGLRIFAKYRVLEQLRVA